MSAMTVTAAGRLGQRGFVRVRDRRGPRGPRRPSLSVWSGPTRSKVKSQLALRRQFERRRVALSSDARPPMDYASQLVQPFAGDAAERRMRVERRLAASAVLAEPFRRLG